MNEQYVYRVITPKDWAIAQSTGEVPLVPIDQKDGYIHLSPRDQVLETVKLYFSPSAQPSVMKISCERLGPGLRWELVESRGGHLFPHLYGGAIPLDAVLATIEIVWSANEDPSFGQENVFQRGE